MSCHYIGNGMNSVVEVVIELFDAGEVDKNSARKLIAACRNGVNWCDGNEYEAVECIRRCRCGKCLVSIEKGKYLFSILDTSFKIDEMFSLLDKGEVPLASDGLCEQCFDEVINEYCKDETAGARERAYIIEKMEERDYLSEGE